MRRLLWRDNSGAAAVPILGAVLLVFLFVGALGLAEGARASAMRTLATRALTAAVESAARSDPSDRNAPERAFRQVLKANLGALPYTAKLTVTGTEVSGRLEIPYKMQYLAAFLPETRLVVTQSVTAPDRKAQP